MIYNTIIIGDDYGVFILKLAKLTDNFTKEVDKQSFIDIIPDSANHGVRSKKIEDLGDNVYPEDIIKIFRYQTMGRDASFYKLFEKMFDLKTHSKFDYLMFNDKFKANFKNYDKKGDLKQEAYILDWVDRIIDNNPILKYYKSYFVAELQGIIENINCIEPKRYDGVLHKAHIILENDEDHNDDVSENDSYKNSDAILSGYAMLRINSSKILDYVTEKTKNDKYIKECRQMIIDLFLGSLMDKQEARSHMLQLKFQEIIVYDIKDLCIKITQVKLQLEDEKNNTIILNGLKNELKSKRKLLEDFNNKDTMELFELKHKTHGDQTNKVINFEICCSLLKVVNEEDKNALKLYIICKNLGDNKNNISWEGLTEIIMEYPRISESVRKIICQYYRKVESIYEYMFNLNNNYFKKRIPDMYNREEVAMVVNKKINDKINSLTLENEKIKEETKVFEKDFKKYKEFHDYQKKKEKCYRELNRNDGCLTGCESMLNQLDALQFEYIKNDTFNDDITRLKNEIQYFDNNHTKIDNVPKESIPELDNFNIIENIDKIISDTENYIENIEKSQNNNSDSESSNESDVTEEQNDLDD